MILKSTLTDVPALTHLINSAYRGESSKKGWTTEAAFLQGSRITEKELAEIITNSKNTVFKFVENSQIIGSVLLVQKENQLYLGMLTVNPELQNAGIGKKLLKQAEIHALELGLSVIAMTVISIREELIAWYKRHGYEDTGQRDSFPLNGTDLVTVEQDLEFVVLEKVIQ